MQFNLVLSDLFFNKKISGQMCLILFIYYQIFNNNLPKYINFSYNTNIWNRKKEENKNGEEEFFFISVSKKNKKIIK